MKKTYRCSNVKFCMEDDNQRRAWEHLQGLTRKDGSYGKILSDALVTVLDGQVKECEEQTDSQSATAIAEETARLVLDGMKELLAEKTLLSGGSEVGTTEQPPEQRQEQDMSEDMMDFAFAMGE